MILGFIRGHAEPRQAARYKKKPIMHQLKTKLQDRKKIFKSHTHTHTHTTHTHTHFFSYPAPARAPARARARARARVCVCVCVCVIF